MLSQCIAQVHAQVARAQSAEAAQEQLESRVAEQAAEEVSKPYYLIAVEAPFSCTPPHLPPPTSLRVIHDPFL